ncbi:MAG: hypothetical protein GXO87_10525 [Chlorobi bacterium]|nr:hypothetical protein [Chlorobiota bacterium]
MKKSENFTDEWNPSHGDYQIDRESTRTYKKKKKRKKVLLTMLAVIVVAIILIGAYFFAESYFLNNGQA